TNNVLDPSPPPVNGPKPLKGYQTTVRVNTKEHTTFYKYFTIYIAKFPQKLKRSTRAWGIPRGTTKESKQLTKPHYWSCHYTAGAATTQLEVPTLYRYGAALNQTTVVKRPPRSHLRTARPHRYPVLGQAPSTHTCLAHVKPGAPN
ncbi:hypothetical protein Taro_000116, partial [Colocasia esculenta]|nr:hypothetical protein [Colocasia esculenta]